MLRHRERHVLLPDFLSDTTTVTALYSQSLGIELFRCCETQAAFSLCHSPAISCVSTSPSSHTARNHTLSLLHLSARVFSLYFTRRVSVTWRVILFFWNYLSWHQTLTLSVTEAFLSNAILSSGPFPFHSKSIFSQLILQRHIFKYTFSPFPTIPFSYSFHTSQWILKYLSHKCL